MPGVASNAKNPPYTHIAVVPTLSSHTQSSWEVTTTCDFVKESAPAGKPTARAGDGKAKKGQRFKQEGILGQKRASRGIQFCVYRLLFLQEYLASLQPCFTAFMRNLECCSGDIWELEDLGSLDLSVSPDGGLPEVTAADFRSHGRWR